MTFNDKANRAALVEDGERSVAIALDETAAQAGSAVKAEDYVGAMAALADLRAPVDAFFDAVTVNADDATLRVNRLKLLSEIRETMNGVADFSQIEG